MRFRGAGLATANRGRKNSRPEKSIDFSLCLAASERNRRTSPRWSVFVVWEGMHRLKSMLRAARIAGVQFVTLELAL